jgi:Flp pilus assembly pilin Flp
MKHFFLDDKGVTFTEYSLITGITCLFLIAVLSTNSETGLTGTFNILNKVL